MTIKEELASRVAILKKIKFFRLDIEEYYKDTVKAVVRFQYKNSLIFFYLTDYSGNVPTWWDFNGVNTVEVHFDTILKMATPEEEEELIFNLDIFNG